MKFEYSVVLILCFGLVSVLLWYFLNLVPVDFAKEYSILFFLILTIGFITYLIHGKGLLVSPKLEISKDVTNGYRNGLVYQRKKFHSAKSVKNDRQKILDETNSLLNQKKLPYLYRRKKYRN